LSEPPRAKVIYVLSAGHSGSTLLDFLLGSMPGVMSTGELTHLPNVLEHDLAESGDDPRDPAELRRRQGGACSCLYRFRHCPVWSQVVDNLSAQLNCDLWQTPQKLKIGMLRGRHPTKWTQRDRWRHHLINRPLRALAYASYGRRPLQPVYRAINKTCLQTPASNSTALYDQIAAASGDTFVVDSSKELVRMLAIHALRPSDVRLIVLLRDIRGCVYSAHKRGEPVEPVADQWMLNYKRLSYFLDLLKDTPKTLVTYEALAADPVATRRDLARFLQLPDPGDELAMNTTDSHLVAGNPMRFNGRIEIKPDHGWREGLPRHLAQRYGDQGQRMYDRIVEKVR
jgi:hypothetical protein